MTCVSIQGLYSSKDNEQCEDVPLDLMMEVLNYLLRFYRLKENKSAD